MTSKADLTKIATVISWLDGYRAHDFKDPAKIDEAVKAADLKYLSRGWKSVREDVKKIYAQQGRLSGILRISKMVSDSIIYVYFAMYFLARMFNIQILMILIRSPLFLISILAITLIYPIFKYKTVKGIREKSETYAKRLPKIRDVIQNLIFYLSEKIRQEKDPEKYKKKKYEIQVNNPDYQGITVIRKPGFFGGEYYTVTPSIIGAVVSKAKRYIKVVDPWATEKETFEALIRVPSKVKIKVLIPDKTGEDKRFKKTWKNVKEKTAGNISLLSSDLSDLKDRVVITKKRAWRAAKREWHTLVEVKDRKKKVALEKSFDEKWGHAHAIT
jgi:hypothetical protein